MQKYALLGLLALMGVLVMTVFTLVVLPKQAPHTDALSAIPSSLDAPLIEIIDPIRGNPNARVTIVEYGDYSCALCQNLEETLSALISEAPQARRFIWKDAPNVQIHPESMTSAMAARCAQDQGQFWEYHDILMADRVDATAERLQGIAQELNMDMTAFDNCMAMEVTRPVVEHTLEEAIRLGVEATPELYINDVRYTGALSLDALRSHIESL